MTKNTLHLIEEDLEAFDLEEGGWLLIALPQIEDYLANWAQFQERHGV